MAEKNTPIHLEVPEGQISVYPPDEFVADKDKDMYYYLNMTRYLTTFYNQPAYGWDYNNTEASNSGTDPSNWSMNMCDDMLNNFAYLFGKQPNIDYRYLTQDITGKTFQAVWTKGRSAGMLVDFANGSFLDSLEDIFFDAKSFSKSVQKEKKDLFEKVRLKHEIKNEMPLPEEMGVDFSPYGKDFEMEEDIDEEEEDYREGLEKAAMEYAREIWNREDMKFVFSKGFLHTLCGLSCIYPYVVNGKVKAKLIPCWNTIWDNRYECDDFGKKMRFWGFVEYITPAQAVSQNPDLANIPGAVNELRAISANYAENLSTFVNYYNARTFYPNNFQWWNVQNGINMVSQVTMFWIAPEDLKFKRYFTVGDQKYYDDGQQNWGIGKKIRVEQSTVQDEQGDFLHFTIHTAKLIGNKWCVNYGKVKNQIRDFYNMANPMPNMKVFIPNQTMGMPQPVMSKLKPHQDKIDFYQFAIQKLVGRDYGKVGIINSSVMGESGYSAIEFSDQLKNIGILVAKTNRDFLNLTSGMKAMEYVDMTNSQYVANYLQFIKAEKLDMYSIVGQSEIGLAQQKNYVSGDVQATTINTSGNVMNYITTGYFKYMEEVITYMANVQKMLDISGKNKEPYVDLSTIKNLKKRTFENVGIYLKIQGKTDAKIQAYILSLSQAWSQNPEQSLIEPDDMLMLLREKSIDTMIEKLQHAIKKKKMEQDKQRKYHDMIGGLEQQKALSAQAQIAAQNAEAAYKQKMSELNLKGAWSVKQEEVKNQLDTKFAIDDALIQNSIPLMFNDTQQPTEAQPQPAQ